MDIKNPHFADSIYTTAHLHKADGVPIIHLKCYCSPVSAKHCSLLNIVNRKIGVRPIVTFSDKSKIKINK